jgi:hypothetical protein
MKKELESKYDFRKVEENRYNTWLNLDLFRAGKDKFRTCMGYNYSRYYYSS